MVFYFEAWDALEGVYLRMLQDARFEPIVVTVPRKLTGYDKFRDEKLVSAFLDSRGVAHERFKFKKSKDGLARLKELDPDYVFLNYPWQRNYKKNYQIEKLVEFTRVCYVPYFSSSLVQEPGIEGVPEHQYTQTTHQLAHMVFLQDRETYEAFISAGRGEHVFLTGTPKVDALIEAKQTTAPIWPIPKADSSSARRFRLLWGPHHSYAQRWLNFGHFVDQAEPMLAYAKAHSEMDIVLRPHPFLFGTMTDRDVMSPEELVSWRERWDSLPNTATDLDTPLPALLLAADALVTDGISFLVEYPLVTNKPAIFWEKPDHWGFTAMGELAANANISVSSADEVWDMVTCARQHAMPDRTRQIQALIDELVPMPRSAAQSIVDFVAEDFLHSSAM